MGLYLYCKNPHEHVALASVAAYVVNLTQTLLISSDDTSQLALACDLKLVNNKWNNIIKLQGGTTGVHGGDQTPLS